MSYLIHFNKNHDPKTGRFTFGDGDSDGVINDHAHRDKYTDYGDSNKMVTVGTKRVRVSHHSYDDEKYSNNLTRVNKYRQKADEEFEKTEEAKKLKAEMIKANDEYKKFADQYWNKGKYILDPETGDGKVVFKDKEFEKNYIEARNKIHKLSTEYYQKKGEYVCKEMLKDLSAYDVSSYGMGWDLPIEYEGSVDRLIKNYGSKYGWSYRDEKIYW